MIGGKIMNSQEIITIVLQIILTGGIGTIAYFLKRTIDRIDKCESDIAKIKEDYITKEDFFREQGKTGTNNGYTAGDKGRKITWIWKSRCSL